MYVGPKKVTRYATNRRERPGKAHLPLRVPARKKRTHAQGTGKVQPPRITNHHFYGRGAGVGRGLGVGLGLAVAQNAKPRLSALPSSGWMGPINVLAPVLMSTVSS